MTPEFGAAELHPGLACHGGGPASGLLVGADRRVAHGLGLLTGADLAVVGLRRGVGALVLLGLIGAGARAGRRIAAAFVVAVADVVVAQRVAVGEIGAEAGGSSGMSTQDGQSQGKGTLVHERSPWVSRANTADGRLRPFK